MSKTKKIKNLELQKEALRHGITLKEVKKIDKWRRKFLTETTDHCIQEHSNGFNAVGILKTPIIHSNTKNVIGIFCCGHNKECNDIVEQIDVSMTIDEAEELVKCINGCINWYKNRIKTLEKEKLKENN